MDSCRICLAHPKKLYSVFEDADILYAEMISSIANVKVAKGDGLPDKICRSCGKKVKEAYDLKILIERSYATFELNSNRLQFNNINEIKIKKEFLKVEKEENKADNQMILGLSESDNVVYNDTTIKKVQIDQKPINMLEFLEHIKEDGDDFDYEESYSACDIQSPYNSDEDNIPLLKRLKKRGRNKSHKKKSRKESDEEFSPGPLGEDDEEYIPDKVKRIAKKRGPYKKKTKDPASNPTNDAPKPKRVNHKSVLTRVLVKPVFLSEIRTLPSKLEKPRKYKCRPKFQLCPHCGKQTKSLKSHMLTHTGLRKFKCDQCSKSYLTKKQLQSHMVQHNSSPSFKCSQCIAVFYTVGSLKNHKLVHSDKRNFACPICNKAFKRKSALERHQLAHNSANKNVKCELCNMSFFSPESLKHHMRIHTGERPFKCELCSQPYSYKHDFNRHCLNKHGIFLKRRKVYVMNEEVLLREREMMREVVRRAQGILSEGESMNPFQSEGTESYLAFMQAVKALKNNQIQIPIDLS